MMDENVVRSREGKTFFFEGIKYRWQGPGYVRVTACGLKRDPDAPPDPATVEDLKKILLTYEGCVSRTERDGDDSDEAQDELATAREALLEVLRQAKVTLG